MNRERYVVTAITRPCGAYSIQVNLVGVFDSEVAAQIVKDSIELKGYKGKISKVDSGKVYSYGHDEGRVETGNRGIILGLYIE